MRAELEGLLVTRYGESIFNSLVLVEPTDQQVEDYNRHRGLISLPIDLSRNPALVVIDTARFIHLRHAWIGRRWREDLRVFVSSGNQPVSQRNRLQDYSSLRVEGLELTFHYNYHNRNIPYTDTMRPLW